MASPRQNPAVDATRVQQTQQIQQIQQRDQDPGSGSGSSAHDLPPTPVPSSDPRLSAVDDEDDAAASAPPDEHDLFKLPALEALKLLSASVELLVHITGDVPPTPPPRTPTNPQMSDMQAEKEKIVRSHSERSLARLRQQAERKAAGEAADREHQPRGQRGLDKLQAYSASMSTQIREQAQHQQQPPQEIDGVHLRQRSPPVSPPGGREAEPYIVVGADSQPLNLQHGAITRKFYSKKEPPISIAQYLLRLHQFCPMSTAVYLATSLYIHRLAVEERAIPVTRRNAHRLVLAGLRVAMKALEDLSYPHTKVAKVGGVSEAELARLEISFCFLAGFELVVGEEALRRHWEALRDGKAHQALRALDVPPLKLGRTPREVTTPGG